MAERPAFQARQYAFAAYIRDPDAAAVPDGTDPRRMAVYRDLFFNNLRNLLGTTFPVLRRLLGDAGWRRLIRAFLRQHHATTPYFPQLPREFLSFLETGYAACVDDPPFLEELAHYEYAELDVALSSETVDAAAIDPDGDLLSGIPVVAPASRLNSYHWPVHRIAADYVPDAPSPAPVHLAVVRGNDDKVRFAELNDVTATLFVRLRDNAERFTGRQQLQRMAAELDFADSDGFVAHGARMLAEMRELGLIAGTRRS